MFVYLDNSATTKVAPEVVEIMAKTMTEDFGNPSSLHRMGLKAEKIMENARSLLASAIGASSDEIYFTSCGTESNTTAIRSAWNSMKRRGRRVITTLAEHSSVLRNVEYLERDSADAIYLPVKSDCSFDMDAFREALSEDTVLVSVMHANNEVGTIFPIAEIADELRTVAKDAILHTDAIQSFTKADCNVGRIKVDVMSLSGHKFHASKGVGALYIRRGLQLPALLLGGNQESGFRSGTENLPAIAGFGEAVRLAERAGAERVAHLAGVKDYLKGLILNNIADVRVNTPEDSLPSILNISFLGCRGEVLLHSLEAEGIYVSTGSACSSRSRGSHVLSAMGLSQEEIEGAIRFSFSEDNSLAQMDYVADKLRAAVMSQRKLRRTFSSRKA